MRDHSARLFLVKKQLLCLQNIVEWAAGSQDTKLSCYVKLVYLRTIVTVQEGNEKKR